MESELKYHVSKKHYLKLRRIFRTSVRRHFRLTNFYFDDPTLRLRRKKFGLRVRIIDGKKAIVTVKYPAKVPRGMPAALKIRHEYESPIPLRRAKAIISGSANIFELKAKPVRLLCRRFSNGLLSRVSVLGKMDTTRTIVPFRNKFKLEIDKSKLFRKTFYEVELETTEPRRADSAIRTFFEEHEIPYIPLKTSKLKRFLDEWKKR